MLKGQVREKQWLRGAGGEKEGGLEGRGWLCESGVGLWSGCSVITADL